MKENLKRADLQAEREHTTKLVDMILKPITEVMTTVTGSKAIQMATSGFNMLSQTVKEMLKELPPVGFRFLKNWLIFQIQGVSGVRNRIKKPVLEKNVF